MVSMDVFASAFGFDTKSDDVWTALGKVTSVNGNILSVMLGGSATPMECEAYCHANVGDIVFVVISKGKARAISDKGGDSANAIINSLGSATANITNDDTYIITQNTNATEQAYYRRPVSKLWAYIKSKIDSTYGIGTVKSKYDTASAASATSTEVAALSLEAGTWVVTATVLFYSNATGYRNAKLSTTSGDTSVSSYYSVTSPAASGTSTILSRSVIIQPSETTTYYLNALQNSGSSITCESQIKAVRIA